MVKIKLIVFCLIVFILFNSVTCYAATSNDVEVKIALFNVRLNGILTNNILNQYPLIVYKDITYFPITYNDARFLGVATSWDKDEGLSVAKSNVTANYSVYDSVLNDPYMVYKAKIANFPISVNEKQIDNKTEEYPLLVFRDITYFPLTWKFAVNEFGWKYTWSKDKGLSIVTREYENSDVESMLNIINRTAFAKSYNFKSTVLLNNQIEETEGSFVGSFDNSLNGKLTFNGQFKLSPALKVFAERNEQLNSWYYNLDCLNIINGEMSMDTTFSGLDGKVFFMNVATKPTVSESRIEIFGDMRKAIKNIVKISNNEQEEKVYLISYNENSEWSSRSLEVHLGTDNNLRKIKLLDSLYQGEQHSHTIEFFDIINY